ncbi:hypothetical protein AB8O38_22110, partial [Saccharomonospora xinjiangensis]|uniref:hypothetical protein n=1 Tax=Saccharomonospora xinjiangensis TaxID=75294 RepID=UPI00350EB328
MALPGTVMIAFGHRPTAAGAVSAGSHRPPAAAAATSRLWHGIARRVLVRQWSGPLRDGGAVRRGQWGG